MNQFEREGGKPEFKVVLTPPEAWWPEINAFCEGEAPDPKKLYSLLRTEHGIAVELIDPMLPKWLPIIRSHPLYRGLDPLRALKVFFFRRDVDAVISVFESSITLISLLRRILPYKPKLLMWDVAPDEQWMPRRMLQDVTIPQIDGLFLLSCSQINYANKRWQTGGKCKVVWQHIDTDFFKPKSHCIDRTILAIGDDHGRDWPTLIKALAPLDVDLVVKTRARLEVPSDSRMRVRQISERLSYVKLRELYEQACIVVIPLKNTLNVSGVGSILESMSMAKPLVVSANEPVLDYVDSGRSAEIVPVGDYVAMRHAVVDLLSDQMRMRDMGKCARERAVSLYGEIAFASRLANTIKGCLRELR